MTLNIGIYNLQMPAMGGGEKLTLVLAEHLSMNHNVSLFCADQPDIPLLERYFEVDLSGVNVAALNSSGALAPFVRKVRNNIPLPIPHPHFRQLQRLKLDLFINNSFASELTCPAPVGIFMCMFPHPIANTASIASYSHVVAISRFTAHWVKRMWGRQADVVYPPCDDMGPPTAKENIILHVGRFIADSDEDERHQKGQRVLLEAFRDAKQLHAAGFKLHFIGSVAPDKRSRLFANALVESASGLPVHFHFDAPRTEVRDLYRRASIFWHSTGYGWSESDHPAKQEHFGIATCEAMSAGAVPIVYASGGQKEIVADGVDGLFWNELDQLVARTMEVANDTVLRERLSTEAINSSRRFSKNEFTAEVDRLVESLIHSQVFQPPNSKTLP